MNRWTTETRNFRTFLLVAQLDPRAIQGRIRQAREEAGLTQQELADLVDRHKRTIENYENVRVPPWPELTKVARVLDRPIEWFLHGETESTDRIEAMDVKLDEVLDEIRTLRELVEALGGRQGISSAGELAARARQAAAVVEEDAQRGARRETPARGRDIA